MERAFVWRKELFLKAQAYKKVDSKSNSLNIRREQLAKKKRAKFQTMYWNLE